MPDPLAEDWGPRKKLAAVLAPFFIWFAAYIYCESREPNCIPERQNAPHEEPATKQSDSLAYPVRIADKPNTKNPEGNAAPSSPIGECSWPCYVVTKMSEDMVALFTAILVWVVYIQVLLMLGQEKWLRRAYKTSAYANTLAKQQNAVSERLFISTNRPRIRIKHVYFDFPETSHGYVWHGVPIPISFAFVNVGVTAAKLREFNIQLSELRMHAKLPQLPKFDNKPQGFDAPHDIIESGMTYVVKDAIQVTLSDQSVSRIFDETNVWHCYGYVEYEDGAASIRKTAFARVLKWSPRGRESVADIGRWEVLKDPDYEYED